MDGDLCGSFGSCISGMVMLLFFSRNPATPNIIGRFRMTRKRPMSCRCEYKSEREAVKPIAVAMVTPVERRATSGLLRDALARGTRHYTSPPAGYVFFYLCIEFSSVRSINAI